MIVKICWAKVLSVVQIKPQCLQRKLCWTMIIHKACSNLCLRMGYRIQSCLPATKMTESLTVKWCLPTGQTSHMCSLQHHYHAEQICKRVKLVPGNIFLPIFRTSDGWAAMTRILPFVIVSTHSFDRQSSLFFFFCIKMFICTNG